MRYGDAWVLKGGAALEFILACCLVNHARCCYDQVAYIERMFAEQPWLRDGVVSWRMDGTNRTLA